VAKKILSHEKLKITFQEYGALLGVRAMLQVGILEDTLDVCGLYFKSNKHHFNMDSIGGVKGCGSVGCIGGNMAIIMNPYLGNEYVDSEYINVNSEYVSEYVTTNRSESLSKLFYPPRKYDYNLITSKMALKAIDNFLTTKKPHWEKVLPKRLLER
jgi:hypothetical protein